MRYLLTRTAALAILGAVVSAVLSSAPVYALGTVRIQQHGGDVKYYKDVHISIRDQSMWITSSDGKGTLVLGKAACTKVGVMVRCIPYDATLMQFGKKNHVPLSSGTVWVNPTKSAQPLEHSTDVVPAHGVILSVVTAKGTQVNLTGVIDDIKK